MDCLELQALITTMTNQVRAAKQGG